MDAAADLVQVSDVRTFSAKCGSSATPPARRCASTDGCRARTGRRASARAVASMSAVVESAVLLHRPELLEVVELAGRARTPPRRWRRCGGRTRPGGSPAIRTCATSRRAPPSASSLQRRKKSAATSAWTVRCAASLHLLTGEHRRTDGARRRRPRGLTVVDRRDLLGGQFAQVSPRRSRRPGSSNSHARPRAPRGVRPHRGRSACRHLDPVGHVVGVVAPVRAPSSIHGSSSTSYRPHGRAVPLPHLPPARRIGVDVGVERSSTRWSPQM